MAPSPSSAPSSRQRPPSGYCRFTLSKPCSLSAVPRCSVCSRSPVSALDRAPRPPSSLARRGSPLSLSFHPRRPMDTPASPSSRVSSPAISHSPSDRLLSLCLPAPHSASISCPLWRPPDPPDSRLKSQRPRRLQQPFLRQDRHRSQPVIARLCCTVCRSTARRLTSPPPTTPSLASSTSPENPPLPSSTPRR